MPPRLPKTQNPRGQRDSQCCEDDFSETIFAHFPNFGNQSTWVAHILFCCLFQLLAWGLVQWFGWSLRLPCLCGTHLIVCVPDDSVSSAAIQSKGLTQTIPNQRTLPLAKGSERINCRKLAGESAPPSWDISSEPAVWHTFPGSILLATDPANISSWCFWTAYPGVLWKEWTQRQIQNKWETQLVSFAPSFEMTPSSTNGIQNSRFASVWGSVSIFPTHTTMFWQGKTSSFPLYIFKLL